MSEQKKKTRERFRLAVFARDEHKCRMCGRKDVTLDAHHITDRNLMPNGGYVKENGIALCDYVGGCHEKAEIYHSTGEALEGWHPNDLYAKIGSSLEKAIEASKRLK
jgi:5-methylcytosine-specific restriction endonuclease McrA